MKKVPIILLLLSLIHTVVSRAQEVPEQQLENLAAETESDTEDDQQIQELEHFRRHPVNLNEAGAEELRQLALLNELQITSFINYRRLTGKLLHLLELQAIPGWDLATIRQLLPYLKIGAVMSMAAETGQRFRQGEHQLLLRMGQLLEKGIEYKKRAEENGYQGSPLQLMFRYTYRFKNSLQYGITGDKDAGESFFKGRQKAGFDFYSVHLFARRLGIIQSLAIGDFTVNLGQGLIQWQSLAFKKSTAITAVKRQSAVLRPYHSAGEFNFQRGLGITIRKGKLESTVFVSLRKLSSNINADTVNQEDYVSSLLTGGYHRNNSELEDRHNLSQFSAGGNFQYRLRQGHIGWNMVYYRYDKPLQKRPEPYNLFAWRGREWKNTSIDYSYTWRNLHFFGEAAIDQAGYASLLNGILVSTDNKVDLSFMHRKLSPAYQSVQGNAFTENTLPSNETGFYMGISIRPYTGWKLDGYLDFYRFPWLKYRVDAPGGGKDWVIQLSYSPNRETLLYTRYRRETKTGNEAGDTAILHVTGLIARESWRTQLNYKVSAMWTFRSRVELVWYNRGGVEAESGFLGLLDLLYKPLMKPWSGGLRLQYGETDGYNSRIYAYENDVLYNYSIPAFSGKGFRYYINVQLDAGDRLTIWAKWAQTLFLEKKYATDEGEGSVGKAGSLFKLQLRYIFQ
ncbi:MAG TPA: helix-hairpin-helix domain-containing protein [Chitinophagaceae bacterium]|nr:helix-hairpin-helix domain-containing protein [Chitinophagaceae bacterium]HPH32009.1 helix-hairpin-helix domain-containing protein [Chitinophagaceae bacterium]